MTAASAFSGCGLADMGLKRAGFDHLWFCESVPVRRSVLRRHFPGCPICVDVKTLADEIEAGKYAAPDLFWMSPPCQDLSQAGLKKGLAGERSGLFFDGIRAVRSLRGRGTRYVVMEQVAGLLNADSAGDLLTILREFAALRPVSWGYRVLDSQYFGVAQVRRRVFFVLDFGGERAREILFESSGVSGSPEARRCSWQKIAGVPAISIGERGETRDKAATVTVSKGAGRRQSDDDNLVCLTFPERDYGSSPLYQNRSDKTQTVDKHGPDCVLVFDASESQSDRSSLGIAYDKVPSQGSTAKPSTILETSTPKSRPILGKGNDSRDATLCTYVCEEAKTVLAGGHSNNPLDENIVATFDPRQITSPAHCRTMEHDRPCGTINDRAMGLVQFNRVRRLLPTETERLFSAPDDYTRWDENGKEIKDSPRYEMLGDGVVCNVSEWIGRGINL